MEPEIQTLHAGNIRVIMPGETAAFSFRGPKKKPHRFYRYRLRFTGDCGVQPSWMWEGGFPLLYRDIDDSLCRETHHSEFSLRITGTSVDYPRRAYYKLVCPPRCTPQFAARPSSGDMWRFSIWAKCTGFSAAAGDAAITMERYLLRPGRDPRRIDGPADETLILPLPVGTCGWKELSLPLKIGPETACLLFTVRADDTNGTLLLEDPELTNTAGETVLPQFAPSNAHHSYLNWLGENLSHKEWTDVRISLNGTALPDASLFQRCHLRSENEIELPPDLIREGMNHLTVTNVTEGWNALPYRMETLQLLWRKIHAAELIAIPETVQANSDFAILIETALDDTDVSVFSENTAVRPLSSRIFFHEAGLHALPFRAGDAGCGLGICIEADGSRCRGRIERIVERGEDGVICGTGDEIYIPQEKAELSEFLSWYLSHHLGNYITFRPTYRWTGSRTRDPACWEWLASLCSDLRLYYCHMIDARELPGLNTNPTRATMKGPFFVGAQGHERDGAFCYWGMQKQSDNEFFYREIRSRRYDSPDDRFNEEKLIYTPQKVYAGIDLDHCADMEEAQQQFVDLLRESLHGVERHTGPSVFFRLFFEAGVKIAGAETMYTSNEVLLSALRGAARAYKRPYTADHLALQWSSTPHDSPEHSRRYQLALFISYLHGVSQINTEEGLWHMEEDFSHYDRFSGCCTSHAAMQRDFVKFIQTHTRRGQPVTGIALLQGKFDGWNGFARQPAWNRSGPEWAFGLPEESWDLVRAYYPDAVLESLYRHPCPVSPQGYYSRTPFGAVDLLPVEADAGCMMGYHSLVFLGFNTMRKPEFDRLTEAVNAGTTLLLAWPHLFTETHHEKAVAGESGIMEGYEKLTGVQLLGFEPCSSFTVGRIRLLENTSVLADKDGVPLITEHRLGKGRVLLFNTREYPAQKEIHSLYEEQMRRLGREENELQSARGWMTTKDTVGFTAYNESDDVRRLYAINTNWWSAEDVPADAELMLREKRFAVSLKRGVIHSFTVFGGALAVWTDDNETEVISLDAGGLRLQGFGEISIRLFGVKNEPHAEGFTAEKIGSCVWQLSGRLQGARHIELPQ